ncbi:MAG: hypothetical protein ATN31_10055 [Candidatus Epulonipiscioides saccharophilum]|nr:MAG: hypothetical protein ATN31_10055 [Epulopiscium sp. AS2M-Bin001]
MKQEKLTILAQAGIHARPAGNLAKAAKTFKSTITLNKDGKIAKATNVISIMGLAAKQNSEIILSVDGEDENEAFEAMKKIILEAE